MKLVASFVVTSFAPNLSESYLSEALILLMYTFCFAGILSVFCAQAGAKKVYAIEASNLAELMKEVVKENKMSDVIEVCFCV